MADAGAGWTNVGVFAFAIHQGTTTSATSYVTSITYGGADVPVTNSDATPFKQADIDAAKAPLQADLDAANDANDTLQGQLDAATDANETLQGQLDAATDELNDYKEHHSNVNGTSVGLSRTLLTGKAYHGKTIGVQMRGTIALPATAVTHQWYIDGKPVAGATKATFKIPANAKGKTVVVRSNGTSNNIKFSVMSNPVTVR